MLRCGRMANGLFKASFKWVGRGRGLAKGDRMQFLFEWFEGRGGVVLSQLASIITLLQKILFNSTAPVTLYKYTVEVT